MSLAGGIWQPVSIHTFALEFLRAERDTFLAQLRAARPNLIRRRWVNASHREMIS
jgi:hypothetical protein